MAPYLIIVAMVPMGMSVGAGSLLVGCVSC